VVADEEALVRNQMPDTTKRGLTPLWYYRSKLLQYRGVRPPLSGRGLLEGALEERGEDDLGLGAGDARVVAEALEGLFEVGGVTRSDVQHGARLAGHRVWRSTASRTSADAILPSV
jgi:hypothetical protein